MRHKWLALGATRLLAIFAATIFLVGVRASAQTETVLYDFHASSVGLTNPWLTLAFDAQGNLYGTAQLGGGTSGEGGVFELSPKAGGGWTEKLVHVFTLGGLGGSTPIGGLVLDAAGNLYGLTVYGGMGRVGVAYELVHTASGGWTEKILHSFGGTGDGRQPRGNLVFHDGNVYGVTINSSPSGDGTVFELVSLTQASWNRIVPWLQQLDLLRQSGGLAIPARGCVGAEARAIAF